MRFWDTSAILPLLIQENTTPDMLALFDDDRTLAYWWATPVECNSALWRRHREGAISHDALLDVLRDLNTLLGSAVEIQPRLALRQRAQHLVATHALRAADALQLAAALTWAEALAAPGMLVSLDIRLREAGQREGLQALP